MSTKDNIAALKDSAKKTEEFVVEGVRVKINPVSSLLFQEIASHIIDPNPPMLPNPDKDGRLEENPFDPSYIAALREAQTQRSLATSDALVMFGLELVEGLPKDDLWLIKLKKLEKMGLINLTGIDFNDQFDKEFAFKKFVAGTNTLIMEVTKASGVSREDINAAVDSFPSNAPR